LKEQSKIVSHLKKRIRISLQVNDLFMPID
jgi:hypothetical protein